jgi:predicted 2-oxoglutarate/Fe(II)-dependent dioxygenase YbiX
MGSDPYYIDGFLDAVTCRRIRARMDEAAVEPAEILADGIALDREVRRVATVDVDRETIAELERCLDATLDDIGRHFGVTLTEREGINVLRYEPGGFYMPHVDRAESEAWPAAARRQVAVVVFLNDGFAGGELCLIDERVDVTPREGLLVAFDAGSLHEVAPVRSGTRDVLVDWLY